MRRSFLRDKHWLLLSILAVLLAPVSGALGQSTSRSQGQSQSDQAPDLQNQDPNQDLQQDEPPLPDQGQSPDQIQDQDRVADQGRIAPAASTANYSYARIVRISYVGGQVSIDHGQGYESATMNVPVTEHNWLKTASDGWAEVQLEDGSLVRLAPDTVVAFSQLGRLSSGNTVTTVDLDQGEAEFKVAQGGNNELQVTVKNKTVELDQPAAFRVTSTNADPMEVVVWKGEVSIRDSESGGEVAVKKNETFVLDPTDVAQYGLDKGAEADDLDQFSQDRDRYLSTYTARGGASQSPYQYGTGDLNYYGQYVDDPDYGTLWQPNGVNSDWDPFANGYWSYEPGFGYTWVSAYPWGWLPFRYGNWVFINHRGWCWAPGNWQRWHTGPTWVNAPPGFRPPRPPAGNNIVISGPPGGRVVRANPGEVGGAGGHNAGTSVGGRLVRQDGGDGIGFRGKGRVFTNDDVARVPRTDVPAQPVHEDNRPKEVERQPVASGSNQTGVGRDREPPRMNRQVDAEPPGRRSRVSDSPAQRDPGPQVSRPVRESAPPVREYTRPAQTMRQSVPAPAPVRQSAPAPAPMRQSAPAAAPMRQSAPPAMHSQPSSGGGSRSGGGKQR
ncbi:MAG TPA: DUF6600 domain-containing protein [Candidatus Angelobacter sp.]|nr:DUF6600 domain-containing protein [Candidatus Angelobacter sp.]